MKITNAPGYLTDIPAKNEPPVNASLQHCRNIRKHKGLMPPIIMDNCISHSLGDYANANAPLNSIQ